MLNILLALLIWSFIGFIWVWCGIMITGTIDPFYLEFQPGWKKILGGPIWWGILIINWIRGFE